MCHQAELWALGVLLHELLSGELPFQPSGPDYEQMKASEKLMELFKMIVRFHPKLEKPCFAHPAAADLLRGLLQKQQKNRAGIADVRRSVLFRGFQWGAFHARQMPPPWIPPPHPKLPKGVGPRKG